MGIPGDMRFKVILESFRDWGRDCWCASGQENTCGKRFGWQLGELPKGYDHKYTYSHLGYNLKPLDLQAAIGREQLKRLPDFVKARRANWESLRAGLADLSGFFEFMQPTPGKRALLVRLHAPRAARGSVLGGRAVPPPRREEGRQPPALRREPACASPRSSSCAGTTRARFRVVGDLKGADRMMQTALFVGVYPGLTGAMLDYVMESIADFCRSHGGRSAKKP